ncbi:hypothetical protein [Catellatospora sp. NPDC049133]|uniref:hypothetical protein n=1 Tax=Catellatospora sp. NPDC049133 TaxID=3155499 RepID=UPI0033EC6FEB
MNAITLPASRNLPRVELLMVALVPPGIMFMILVINPGPSGISSSSTLVPCRGGAVWLTGRD